MVKKKVSKKYSIANTFETNVSKQDDFRKILREKITSQAIRNIVVKPSRLTDVVHVYTPSDLDELIGTHKRVYSKKVLLAKEKSLRKRRFMNVVLGITPADLIGIAQQ